MQLSIVIPAFNEGHKIVETLEKTSTFCAREYSAWEIIVVDDGSTDDTARRVSRFSDVRFLRNERNRGKGYSVRRGILEASNDPVLFMDADLSTPIEEARNLSEAVELGADVAIASRQPSAGKKVQRTVGRRLMAAVFRTLVKAIVLRGFHDTQCGFKMFRLEAAHDIFPRQRIDRWGFDVEVLFVARKLGYRIVEVPVAWEESAETRLKLTTPLTMIGDLLRVRAHGALGHYRRTDAAPDRAARKR